MSDEKFEEFLQREATAYNAPPPEVPREEMWAVVARARAARPTVPASAPGAAPIVRALPSRPNGVRYTAWMGMAATLLIGVGIGRFVLERTPEAAGPATVATVNPADAPTPAADLPIVPDQVRDEAPNGASPPSAIEPRGGRRTTVRLAAATSDAPASSLATGPNARTTSGTTDGGTSGNASGNDPLTTPYRVASQQHLARAEALVAVVATAPRDAMIDSLTDRWAREMLTNTRLLLDSPAGEDPIRRRLLEDLETLLVQLVQRSGTAVDERALFDRTLDRTQLLTRLRSGAAGT
jgi:hypothetical protein